MAKCSWKTRTFYRQLVSVIRDSRRQNYRPLNSRRCTRA